MNATFLENIPFFTKNSIPWKIYSDELNFWETETLQNIVFEKDKETRMIQYEKTEIDISLSDMEILRQEKNRLNLEPVVYTRQNLSKEGDEPMIHLTHCHEKHLSEVHLNTPGNSSSPLSLVQNLNHTIVPEYCSAPCPVLLAQESDLDLPIAIRKGTRTCTRHPISKYVSYDRLS